MKRWIPKKGETVTLAGYVDAGGISVDSWTGKVLKVSKFDTRAGRVWLTLDGLGRTEAREEEITIHETAEPANVYSRRPHRSA